VAIVLLGIVPVFAQRARERPSTDMKDAKNVVKLIHEGQLSLKDATRIAEEHVDGDALTATCTVWPTKGEQAERGDAQPAGEHLIFEITCFAKDKVQTVKVDGLTKKIVKP